MKKITKVEKENEVNDDATIEQIKTYIFVATTAIVVTLYVHETFATNNRVDKIEVEQSNQQKISCLTALEVGVNKSHLKEICQLNIK